MTHHRRRWTAAGAIVLATTLGACSSSPSSEDFRAQELLVTQQELPKGFAVTPLDGESVRSGDEGEQSPSVEGCVSPVTTWFPTVDESTDKVGQIIEYPNVAVLAETLGKGEASLDTVRDYIEHCGEYERKVPGTSLHVSVEKVAVPGLDATSAVGYRDVLTLPTGEVSSSTYYFARKAGVNVTMALRVSTGAPSEQQMGVLNAVFDGQLRKIPL